MNKKLWSLFILIIVILFAIYFKIIIEPDNKEKNDSYPIHENITTTVFWIGEEANEENDFIPNTNSAWDDRWIEHYGGVDDPYNRSGYLPANFTPLENPFYFALPYNDFEEDGNRRSDAKEVVYWFETREWNESESSCKNRWIKLIKPEKTAYAQWEDTGPFIENDSAYVFGGKSPKNYQQNHAGLDISPAVRDYLNLSLFDVVNWQFVDFDDVPDGPWKEIISESQVYWE